MQEVDSYEYAEAVSITSDLNKEFWENLTAKKWSDRRDALQRLKSLASQPKLAPGDYSEVLRELRKVVVKDSNVVCVGEAILCIGAFAKSLRASFSVSRELHKRSYESCSPCSKQRMKALLHCDRLAGWNLSAVRKAADAQPKIFLLPFPITHCCGHISMAVRVIQSQHDI